MNPYLYLKTDHPTDGKPMLWRTTVRDAQAPEFNLMVGPYNSGPSLYRIRAWENRLAELDSDKIELTPLSITDPADDSFKRTVHCGYADNPNPRPFIINGKVYPEIVARLYAGTRYVHFGCTMYGESLTDAAQARLRDLYAGEIEEFILRYADEIKAKHREAQIARLRDEAHKVAGQIKDLLEGLKA